MKLAHGNISVYIPRKTQNFIKICMAYATEELGIKSFSSFILLCIKHFINTLNKEQKSKFEEIGARLAKEETPRSAEFVDQFISRGKTHGSRSTKKRRP